VRLVVLGATGGTGLEIVRQAAEHGHSVTAFVRSPDKLKALRDRILIKQGDLLNTSDLEQVVNGHDAVLSGFGPRAPVSKADANLLQRFAVALTRAMQRVGIRRVVVESVGFLFKNAIIPPAYVLGRLFFPGIVADASAMEKVIEQSGLEWTIARPPRLTDKPYTGRYRVGEGRLPAFAFSISRADVADFMIKAVEGKSLIGKIAGVCN
jgi:putative NADH-flavin reductase